jgi:hypothetical protein
MARILVFITAISLLTSCFPRRLERNAFRKSYFCFSENLISDTLGLQHKGFYRFSIEDKKEGYIYPVLGCVFYSNGMFISNFDPIRFQKTKEASYNFYRRHTQWGTYKIIGDTIKALSIDSPGMMYCATTEFWFLILGNNTLKPIAQSVYKPATFKSIEEFKKNPNTKNITSSKFILYDSLPNPDKSWIMKERWFWCNKSKFMEWKKSH